MLLKSDFMETAQTSGVWLASCLDAGQNELIHDSASSCLVVGVLFFLDLLNDAVRWCVCDTVPRSSARD